jgi:peptidoglycan/LPS O-acetylase OafA/YrhL
VDKEPATHKLHPIEGLRGYLAIMVMITHIFNFGAYISIPDFFKNSSDLYSVLNQGDLAVKCFMIISGFVIFLLIDTKKETYGDYLTRRFLRIFPVYFLLLLISIPCLRLSSSVLEMTTSMQSAEAIRSTSAIYHSLWSHLWIHFPLHLVMLHGMVPSTVLPNSPTAFLGPAWSLSLEWQFYLIAPLWYSCFVTEIAWKKIFMYVICLIFILKGHYFFATIQNGAILLNYIVFFVTGIASYFLYKKVKQFEIPKDTVLPIAVILALGSYRSAEKPSGMIPYILWLVVFALILEPKHSLTSRLFSPVFTNPVSLWLGKISYSIYLSHALVLVVLQYVLLKSFANISQTHLLYWLLVATPLITLPLSHLLYKTVERPFMYYGKRAVAR